MRQNQNQFYMNQNQIELINKLIQKKAYKLYFILQPILYKLSNTYQILQNPLIYIREQSNITKESSNNKHIQMNSDNKKYLLINKYQVDYTKMLGKGAMAKVYLGYYSPSYEETDKNAKFAVKEISINSSFIATDSILMEINLLRKMTHPYILKYVDAKKSPVSLYLILEYCDEGTLQDFILNQKEDLDEGILKRFIAQTIIALEFLKQHSIIHRDIKPKNILIHKGNIKISDFGVAKIITKHNSEKQTTTFSGTIQFMSPQILMQDKYTYQTDIWSLGITFYFMIFKQLPWKAYKVLGILDQIEQQNGVDIPEEVNGMDPLLLDMLKKMLRYEENERITIQQLKQHPYIKDQITKLELEIQQDPKTIESKEITKAEFMLNSLAMDQKIEPKELERRSREVNQVLRASQFIIDSARQAYRKLVNYKEQIIFLKYVLDNLRSYHKKKDLIQEELFRKCEFLLVKKCYIIAKDLHQILLFGTHTQGSIIIPKQQFTELIEGNFFYFKSFRQEVGRLYEDFKTEWLNTKESFFSYQRKEGIKNMRPRGDAYSQNITAETPNLVLAFNDCFLQLFYTLSKGIVETYQNRLSEQIKDSTILFNHGVKIEFIYDLMIILCFPNIKDIGNIKTYKQKKKKKKISCQEYIYRIGIAYDLWKNQYEAYDQNKLSVSSNE